VGSSSRSVLGSCARAAANDALLFAAAQRPEIPLAKGERVRGPHGAPDRFEVVRRFEETIFVRCPAHQNNLFRGEWKFQPQVLRNERDLPREKTPAPTYDLGSTVDTSPFILATKTRHDAQHRGFARSVRTCDRDKLRRRKTGVDTGQHRGAVIGLPDVLE